jgi:uracil-DNA glycosylase
MNWEKSKHLFHPSHSEWAREFIESKECDEIYSFLQAKKKEGVSIAPSSSVVWRCFKETPLDEIKVVVVGYCPYHTFTNDGYPVADGLALSCGVTNRLQPSLEVFYNGIEKELYPDDYLTRYRDPDLTHLAHQGVLLYNASLTVEEGKPGSHMELWEPLNKYLFKQVFDKLDVPFLFLGNEAARYASILFFKHNFIISHPASATYSSIEWDTKNAFKKIQRIVKYNTGTEIEWMKKIKD